MKREANLSRTTRAWLSVTIARRVWNTDQDHSSQSFKRTKRSVVGGRAFHGGRVDENKKARSKK